MKDVASDIAARIGCSVSIPASLPDYQMEAPIGLTMREVLASMAAAWGGNWAGRGSGAVAFAGSENTVLTMLPLGDSLGTFKASNRAMALTAIGEAVSFSGVRLFWSDTDCYEAGNCNSGPLECYCEWATQEMANNILNAILGKSFQSFEASNAWLHPAVEPGDSINIGGVSSQIITMTGALGAGCAVDIGFPGAEADEDEYPYVGQVQKTLQKKVNLGKAYYGATISREKGLTISRSDGQSEAVFNSDVFSMRAKDTSGQMIDCIYFDTLAQLYRITGQVEIDGSLVTQNLYAEEGDIVALTVDSLLTSQRVKKYLTGDTSNDNHISIQGNRAKWISATVKYSGGSPVVVQHKNKDGKPLYWTADPATAQVVDGHYEIDGRRVTTTVTNTGWPVQVYDYEEETAMWINFVGNIPVLTMGGETTLEPRTASLMRTATDSGFQISYVTKDGKQIYIQMTDDGRIVFKDGLEKIDLSTLDDLNKFSIVYNGKAVEYGLVETDTGYRMTKPDGEVVQIVT